MTGLLVEIGNVLYLENEAISNIDVLSKALLDIMDNIGNVDNLDNVM